MTKYKFKESYNPSFLEDRIVAKVLSDRKNKDYLLRIVKGVFKDEDIFKSNEFKFLNVKNETKSGCGACLVIEDDEVILDIEVNHQVKIDNKNMLCILNHRKRNYDKIKPIYQLNLNFYDQFGEGQFIYESVLMEKNLHLTHTESLTIADVNLEYLFNLNYDYIRSLSDDSLEKSLYILTCNDKSRLDELYMGDDIMIGVKEQLFENDAAFKSRYYYDFGKEDGIAEGIEQTRREVIFNMLGDGLNSITIAEYLDIKVEDVEKIVSE